MLSHSELVGLVEQLMDGAEGSEAEAILAQLRMQLPHPALFGLIYFPEQVPGFAVAQPTADQVVTFAAAYCPRPLAEGELAEVLDRLINQSEDGAVPQSEDSYRLEDTLPSFDWGPAIAWARFQRWSGAKLARRIHSGEMERDPDYRRWLEDMIETEME